MSYEEPKDDQYLKSRRYIVDDLRKATIGNDWRSDEEVELNYNPLFHFISNLVQYLPCNFLYVLCSKY